MVGFTKPRAIGFNHVALEVGDIEEALAFYGRIFDFQLRGKSKTMAFIDLGDQFIALQTGRKQPADDGRHFGLVVDDKEAARAALKAAGVKPIDGLPARYDLLPGRVSFAADDRMIPPPAQRMMAERAGAAVVEVAGSHAVYVSKPEAVAKLVEEAANG